MTQPSHEADVEVSAADTRRAIEEGSATIIDVRRAEERAEGLIEGSLEIGLDELMQRAGEIPRDRTVIFYCKSGSRSRMAALAFRAPRLQRLPARPRTVAAVAPAQGGDGGVRPVAEGELAGPLLRPQLCAARAAC